MFYKLFEDFTLYLKDGKLYTKGLFGQLTFVNYAYNKKYYKKREIIKLT